MLGEPTEGFKFTISEHYDYLMCLLDRREQCDYPKEFNHQPLQVIAFLFLATYHLKKASENYLPNQSWDNLA